MTHRHTSIAITSGDPAGIGPQVTIAALQRFSSEVLNRVILFGHRSVLAKFNEELLTRISVIEPEPLKEISPGAPNMESARAQVAYLEAAAELAQRGQIAALVTAPISKHWAQRAGFEFPGHTEFLGARLNAKRIAMMFAGPRLRVVLATTHIPLSKVAASLDHSNIAETIVLFHRTLRDDFAIANPRIGVLGLNPHAGERGALGLEEEQIIAPAIELARKEIETLGGIVLGPLVPDAAYRQKLDGFVAMYHDQALIPLKLLDFEAAVNVTLGLPIVRTSPDHGVAYDIAGTKEPRHASMQAAIELALELADKRSARERNPPQL